jgi:Activator of Hsp90 ATPase homolog 1-like protein
MAAPTIPPLAKSVTVPWTQEASFRRFTADIASWWPLRTHSVGEDRAETVVFEARPGGRIYEKIKGGSESTWGTVTAWEPPGRVAFSWHPGQDPSRAQEVEVRFVAVESGTRLELTHTGWEKLGEMARRARRAYPLGWAYVLRLWAGRKSSVLVKSVDALMWLLRPLQKRAARKLAEQGALERRG